MESHTRIYTQCVVHLNTDWQISWFFFICVSACINSRGQTLERLSLSSIQESLIYIYSQHYVIYKREHFLEYRNEWYLSSAQMRLYSRRSLGWSLAPLCFGNASVTITAVFIDYTCVRVCVCTLIFRLLGKGASYIYRDFSVQWSRRIYIYLIMLTE